MIVLLLFVLDRLVHAFFHVPLLFSVLVYVVYRLLQNELCWYSVGWYIALICLLLEDYLQCGRFGFVVLVTFPLFLMVAGLRHKLFYAKSVLFGVFITLFFIIYDQVVQGMVLGRWALNDVTSSKILINLTVGYVIFWGMRGNRFLLAKKRKVWTPSRKDAS